MKCISCDSEWTLVNCNTCNEIACEECMYVVKPSENCERHNFLLAGKE